MVYPFLITLREGLEAALLLGIILAYLTKIGQRQLFKQVWGGAGAAVLLSLGAGLGVYFTVGELSSLVLDTVEGVAMFAAAGLLTGMIFWMRRHAGSLKRDLQVRAEQAVAGGAPLAVAGLAFTVVAREGVETALFLLAGSFQAGAGWAYVVGGLAGLVLASVLGYLVYKGGTRLTLQVFFNVTGALLIVFAAGLVMNGLKEFHEVSLIPALVPHVWDTYAYFSDTTPAGRLAATLLGYDASPSLLQVLAYFGYLVFAGYFYFGRRSQPSTAGAMANTRG